MAHASNNFLPKGIEVTCPECGDLIAVAERDIDAGSTLFLSYFDLRQEGHENGKGMNCKKCGAKFAGNFIHTSQGWK